MACDLIENYDGHPAFQFFRDFNPDCDWSEELAGEIGDYIVIARRAGEDFFLNAPVITQPDGSQAPDKTCYRIEKRIVTSDDTLEISMAADGGQAVVFKPVKE